MTKKVTEIRRRVLQDDQVFECELFEAHSDYLIVRYINPVDQHVDDTQIPANSTTLAHYQQDQPAVWWEMFDPDKDRIGDLIHLSSPVDVQEERVVYTDLLLDIWHVPGKPPKLLDEDELDEAVEAGAISAHRVRVIRDVADEIIADLPGHAPPQWHKLDPASEPNS